MTLAVSKAKEEGSTAVICASTGNTSAAAAAYAAKGNMKCLCAGTLGKDCSRETLAGDDTRRQGLGDRREL